MLSPVHGLLVFFIKLKKKLQQQQQKLECHARSIVSPVLPAVFITYYQSSLGRVSLSGAAGSAQHEGHEPEICILGNELTSSLFFMASSFDRA